MITKPAIKILKRLQSEEGMTVEEACQIDNNSRELMLSLQKEGYIESYSVYLPEQNYEIYYRASDIGREFLVQRSNKNFVTYYPLVISTLALLGAFRGEVLYILRSLVQLLK